VAVRDYGQYCGVTRGLELVGERWALLIVRDLLVGPRRYGELAAGLPRIPSNILAARLKELQAAGVIRRVPRSRIIIYELTPYGRELEPVVLALGAWGFKAMGDPRDEQIITPDSMTMALRTAFRPTVARTLPTTAYAAHFGPAELFIRVTGPSQREDSFRGDGFQVTDQDSGMAGPSVSGWECFGQQERHDADQQQSQDGQGDEGAPPIGEPE